MSRRKLSYGSQDWFSALHSEVRVPASVRAYANRLQDVDIDPQTVYPQTVYPQAAPCPPGFRYRPKRKPGQRKCTKEKVKSVLSFLQMLATQNRISIFKVRKDKKGYTRTLLTIPQLKTRLTRNGVSYKINKSKFGMEQQNPPWRDTQEPPFGVLEPRRNISSRNIRRDSGDVLGEMENLHRKRKRDRMRREIAGDIIFPERPWHGAAPPYATTIQRYARGMLGRNINRFGVLPGREQGPDEPEDPRIAYEIEKKRKAAERNRKWRAAKSEANSEKLEAVREAQMDRAAADAIRYLGMTPKERTLAKARERRELGKRAKEFLASQGAGSSSDPRPGLDFRVLEPDFGKTRYP